MDTEKFAVFSVECTSLFYNQSLKFMNYNITNIFHVVIFILSVIDS